MSAAAGDPKRVVLTCALTGVLTDAAQHPVPVTPEEMASEARRAWDAGATVMHVHFRRQEPGKGHLPSWDPEVALEIADAIRDACRGVILNMTTGVVGADIAGPLGCLRRLRPEIAACNAGSLNYLKTRSDGSWAWPPLLFDNPVAKVAAFLDAMAETATRPELECFDVGIVRSAGLYLQNGLLPQDQTPLVNLVLGVASGMPADSDLLDYLVPRLPEWIADGVHWQTTVIGRQEVWDVHRRTAELGGSLRTGLEDTFYLPDGSKAESNGELIEALAGTARAAGREPASATDARTKFGLPAGS
ncbi:MAG: 3-keto-5-aminohexanoate cleavage protein [Thermoanaerobaculia bacterium]|nr:3-keto-5-aminohexanoate cleavage protein [Thermoanaerobaculia bacterium]